jgi:hypothetical protein
VLGISFEALGLGVSKAWGLPESIQRCIAKPSGDPPSVAPKDAASRLRWGARAANEMADAMLHADPAVVDQRLDVVAKRYHKSLGLSLGQIHTASTSARKKLLDLAEAMDLRVRADSPAAHLLNPGGALTATKIEYSKEDHDASGIERTYRLRK